ncbi:hypothetical protein AJ88_08515 [Mesorhizobium amorphae CCBAU 01583]|nr:hypothetical protein AJ88_08515 [Mesorhizobium amorphae CCBAU 01583]
MIHERAGHAGLAMSQQVVFRSKKKFVERFGDPDGDHILLDAFSDLNARVDAVFHQIKVKILDKDFELNFGVPCKEAADKRGYQDSCCRP